MSSFFDDPDDEQEDSYPSGGQARASSSRAPSLAATSPAARSRTFSLIPGTETDSHRDVDSEIGGGGRSGVDLDMDEGEEDNDVKRLGGCWVRERGTGDIMPWEGDLIDLLFDKLEQQVSTTTAARIASERARA